jgi:hypothetical protein
MKKLPKSLTTITPFSKFLALCLFILVPIAAFYLGIHYEQQTRQGFPNPFCKKWETICDPNVVDANGGCAPKTICIDPSPTPKPTN